MRTRLDAGNAGPGGPPGGGRRGRRERSRLVLVAHGYGGRLDRLGIVAPHGT
jgi:hypothetical protein